MDTGYLNITDSGSNEGVSGPVVGIAKEYEDYNLYINNFKDGIEPMVDEVKRLRQLINEVPGLIRNVNNMDDYRSWQERAGLIRRVVLDSNEFYWVRHQGESWRMGYVSGEGADKAICIMDGVDTKVVYLNRINGLDYDFIRVVKPGIGNEG